MQSGFTKNRVSSTSNGNGGRTTRKLLKRSSSNVAKAAQKSARTSSSSIASPPFAADSRNKLDVYGVNWRVLRTDSNMLRDMAVSTLGSSVETVVDKPEQLLRAVLGSCDDERELKFICAMLDLNVQEIPNDRKALVDEIVNTMFTKESQRCASTEQQSTCVVAASPKKIDSNCDDYV